MKNLESLFVSEFKEAVKGGYKRSINDIQLPKTCEKWRVSGVNKYVVRDVQENVFKPLEGRVVEQPPKGYVIKRRVVDKVTRKYKVVDGSYVYEDYKVPANSMVVVSNCSLNLSYDWFKINNKDGYGYVDYITRGNQKLYLYVLPKSLLYQVHQTALVLSSKSSMHCYTGIGYQTWDKGIIYLYVIPYSPTKKYIDSKVLKTGITLGYKDCCSELVSYWLKTGLIPNLNLSQLADYTNLVEKNVSISYDEYNPVEPLPINHKEILE